MNANFLRPSARKKTTSAGLLPDDIAGLSARQARPVGRACCCAAKAAVQVIMPPTPARPHSTEMLLCGHHYRASRAALAAARATIRKLAGTSGDIALWIGIDSPHHAIPAS